MKKNGKKSRKIQHKSLMVLGIPACILLGVLIVYVQNKTSVLEKMLESLTNTKEVVTKEQQVVETPPPYTKELRIALVDEDGDIYRQSLVLKASSDMLISYGEEHVTMSKDMLFEVDVNKIKEQQGVIISSQGGEIFLQDSAGQWSNGYEGQLELVPVGENFAVVNLISLEQYLKRVVPSEMPRTYGQEALKAQAICARTYAYAHSNTYAYPEVFAHMDDTTSFQVYNKVGETAETNQAVADTAGMVLMSGDALISALYYSTSCGYEQDGGLFGNDMDAEVLPCVYLGSAALSTDFEDYIKHPDQGAYEANERYFRWTTELDLTKGPSLRETLVSMLAHEQIVSGDKKIMKRLQDASLTNQQALGDLKSIEVVKRNAGGAVEVLTLQFTKGQITVEGQLHIRDALGLLSQDIHLQNGDIVASNQRLPSSAIAFESIDGNRLKVYGGGFGHGVGMSQNGAKNLASMGFSYEDILLTFYHNTRITEI